MGTEVQWMKKKYVTHKPTKTVRPKADGDARLGGKKKRKKLTDAQKRLLPPQRTRIMVLDAATGKCRMIDA